MKRVKVAIVLLFVPLAGVIVWQAVKSSEPVYKGRTLTSWLKDAPDFIVVGDSPYAAYPSPGQDRLVSPLFKNNAARKPNYFARAQAWEALHQIGTNAIPTLLHLLRAKDSALKTRYMSLVQRQHLIEIQSTPSDYWNYAAAWGFEVLGSSARSAVPDLIQIVADNVSPSSCKCALVSLGFVGPPARQSVPVLMSMATNANFAARRWAGIALAEIDPEAAAKAGITNAP